MWNCTPLNGIIGFTDLLMKTDLDIDQSEYINIVNESAVILMDIINDVLDFQNWIRKLELNIEEVDLCINKQVNFQASKFKRILISVRSRRWFTSFYLCWLGTAKTDYCKLDRKCFKIHNGRFYTVKC
jgi:signal transduction histidine kinase